MQLLADIELAPCSDQIVLRRRDLPRAIDAGALDTQVLARDTAQLAGDLCFLAEHGEFEIGVGEPGEWLALGNQRAVLHEQLFHLTPAHHADEGGRGGHHARADRQVIVEGGAGHFACLDVVRIDIGRTARGDRAPPDKGNRDYRDGDQQPPVAPPRHLLLFDLAIHRGTGCGRRQTVGLFGCVRHHVASIAEQG